MKIIGARVATLLSYLLFLSIILPGFVQGGTRYEVTGGLDSEPDSQNTTQFVPGRVLVRFRQSTMSLAERDLVSEAGAIDTGELGVTGVHVLQLRAGVNEEATVKSLQSSGQVEFAELDRLISPADLVPNDPWYQNWEWHLQRIHGPGAWSRNTGNSNVVIAILDTGVDGTH